MRFPFQPAQAGARSFRRRRRRFPRLPLAIVASRGLSRAGGRLSLPRRLELDAGAARFRQTDGDRLLGGTSAMLALTDVLDLFADELTSLRARRFSFPLVLAGAFQRLAFRHLTPRGTVDAQP